MNQVFLYAVVFAVISYYLYTTTPLFKSTSSRVLAGLQNQSQPTSTCPRVAIGYNANLDLVVNALEVLNKLNIKPAGAESHTQISSLSDFQETFSYYLRTGSAAERVVSTSSLFKEITDAAASLEHKQYLTGGNAALMANSLASRGCPVLLGGSVGNILSSLLHADVIVTKDDLNPVVNDEVHLIMEYAKGAEWGNYTAPRANRFIVTRDETNARIAPLELFHKSLSNFDPTYIIISGLHLLETLPVEERTARLDTMLGLLHEIPRLTKNGNERIAAHLELASIGSPDLLRDLATRVLPRVDSLGLNEQELGGIYLVTGGKDHDSDAFKSPQVSTVVSAIKHLFALADAHAHAGSPRTLTRVHFHCLHFHLIVQRQGSMWEPGTQSVAQGALACSEQACNHNGVDVLLSPQFEISQNKFLTLDFDHPVTTWSFGELDFYLAPVLVCRVPTRTVGLGDAISGVGLTNHKTKRPLKY
eukprot:Phypoly_transcript_08549.p1 GENE.Phypoly_transcript_08549~~Phypoly_transcript_08549.p1  ORF type:complete len:475 (+),score=54.57 Phypoly_transcript_08549:67-1491(+)